jgi:hypothetical protein
VIRDGWKKNSLFLHLQRYDFEAQNTKRSGTFTNCSWEAMIASFELTIYMLPIIPLFLICGEKIYSKICYIYVYFISWSYRIPVLKCYG